MNPQTMRFTVIDKDYAEVEVNFAFHKPLAYSLIVIGCILLGLSILLEFTYGGGIALIVIGAVFFGVAYYIYVLRKRLIIDKKEGKMRVINSLGILYHKIIYEWTIDQILHFEAASEIHIAESRIDGKYTVYSIGNEIADHISDAVYKKKRSPDIDLSARGTFYLGAFIVKLKTGEIIHALTHRFPDPPENCVKHAALFLKGEYTTPGTVYT
ncbi:MAG: hypothetical protein LUQ65_00095 [Candidatus Helarchaeota archaeon]|nr:hypothetical protein [Candidatus Helarchaeota archaeon]